MQIDPIRKRFTIINRIQELRTMIRKDLKYKILFDYLLVFEILTKIFHFLR